MSKILHLAERAYGGGAESVFRDTVKALKKRDTRNTHLVACVSHPMLSDFEIDLDFYAKRKVGVNLALSQIYSSRNYKKLKSFLRTQRPEIIHIQSYGNLSPSILKAVWWYKKESSKVKVVQTVHTFEYTCSHHAAYDYKLKKRCLDCANSTFKFKIFYRRCSRLGLFHSIGKGITSLIASYFINKGVIDNWITPSEFLKSTMTPSICTVNKVTVIKNPISGILIQKELSNLPVKNRVIVYFGRLSEEKNLQLLLKAFSSIVAQDVNSQLKIIGGGPERTKLESLATDLELWNNIEFINFVPQIELQELLKNAAIAVLPSKCFETASMLVFEAVASGVIPIVADHGGMKEMVEWLSCGLVFKGNDCEDLKDKIEWALENYENYLSVIITAQNLIKTDLSLKRYAGKLISQYNTH